MKSLPEARFMNYVTLKQLEGDQKMQQRRAQQVVNAEPWNIPRPSPGQKEMATAGKLAKEVGKRMHFVQQMFGFSLGRQKK
jgi:hypothetical protein